MPATDTLTRAKEYLVSAFEIPLEHGESESSYCVQVSQAAALIAQVETDRERNEHLATIAEHLEHIRSHLDDIGTVLLKVAGSEGALKVDAWTYDARRELG
jgi:hypothetical protein